MSDSICLLIHSLCSKLKLALLMVYKTDIYLLLCILCSVCIARKIVVLELSKEMLWHFMWSFRLPLVNWSHV